MKKKLFLLLCALLTMIGVQNVKAYQTPVADGVYYIQNVKTGKFVNYGWNYGARMRVDDYGTAWRLIADGGNFKIQAYVTSDRNFQDNEWMYADVGGDRIRSYTISGVAGEDGVYTLKNTTNNLNVYVYLKEGGDKYFIAGNAIKGDNYNDDDQTYWRFLSQAERDAYIAAQVHEGEAAILANYGLTLPANQSLSEYLEVSTYFKSTEVSVAAMNSWTWTSASPGTASSYNTTDLEVFQGANDDERKVGGTLTKQMTGLSAGLYKVTLSAMYRFGTNGNCYTNEKTNGYKGLNGGAYFSAGGNAVPLATWASSCTSNSNPDSPSEFNTIVGNGGYQNVTFANVTGSTLDLEVGIPSSIVRGWFVTKEAKAIRYNLKTLSEGAIALPASGAMTVGQWYYYDFATADDYYFVASNLSSVSYSTDGSQLVTVTGDPLPTKISSITAGSRYYFKSTENQTLTIAASDVTSKMSNPSFELKSAGTEQTVVVTSSGATALALYGWTENLNGINDLRNSDWVNSTTQGTSTRYSNAIASVDGTWHYYARKGWSDQNTADITLTSNDMTLPRGYYVLSCKYLLEENYRAANPSNGSFLTLKAVNGSQATEQESPKAYTHNDVNAVYTQTEWQTLSVAFNVTSESTIQAVLALTPRGGVNTEVHVDDFSLTYSPFADAADYAALNVAIEDAKTHAPGFEAGEYAPYTNVDAMVALAKAEAIDQDADNSKSVVLTLIDALNNATWTANDSEVDAIYDGDFSSTENDGAPAGWSLTGATGTGNSSNVIGGAFRPRAFVLTSGTNYDKLATFGQGDGVRSCFYIRYDDRTAKNAVFTYGVTNGYTMPLKTGKIYKLTAMAGGWGHTKDIKFAIVNANDENIVAKTLTLNDIDKSQSAKDYEMYFVVPSNDNYELQVTNATSSENNAAVISNIELKSTDALVFDDNAAVPTYAPGTYPSVKITRTLTAGKWATAVYPFAVSGVDNIAVLDNYNSGTGEISFAIAAASTANEPFLMRSTAGTTAISLSNVAVAATVAEPEVTKSVASLKGVYASDNVPVSDEENVRYVVSNNQLYKVDGAVSIKPFRAYFELTGANAEARPTLRFDDATAINAIEAAEAKAEGLKDGKYIINNKVVIVKNGVKYGANGQKLN